jgi:DNA-directed RNA polymerase specialized sigma subunit
MDKSRLVEYKSIVEEIGALESEIESLRRGYPASSLQGNGSGYKSGKDKVGNSVARLGELSELLSIKMSCLIETRKEIEAAIADLPSLERRIIRLRYIRGLSWRQVADKLRYDLRYVMRLHAQILRKLEKL